MAQYDIFLSFDISDSAVVNSLIDRLRRDISGLRIFSKNKGDELSEFDRINIVRAIDESSSVVFIVSENSLANQICEKEVMYAKNTAKRVIPYLLPEMSLKGWLLYDFGRINCVNSTNEEEVAQFIENLRERLLQTNNQNEPEDFQDAQLNTGQNSNPASTSYAPNESLESNASLVTTLNPSSDPTEDFTPSFQENANTNTIETQLVFDHTTGEFVSRIVGRNGNNQGKEPNYPEDYYSMLSSNTGDAAFNTDNASLESQKRTYVNGHEYVDLGLPSGLKWASCNLGSYRIEDSGTYYSWGEIKPKAPYNTSNSTTYKKDIEGLKNEGYLDDKGNLSLSHDAAHKDWGASWRIPTKDEFEELHSNTTLSWHRVNGIDGCMLKSKINGNTIFFPAFGRKDGSTVKDNGILGLFWSSTVCENNDTEASRSALGLNLFSIRASARYLGLSIRPVSD